MHDLINEAAMVKVSASKELVVCHVFYLARFSVLVVSSVERAFPVLAYLFMTSLKDSLVKC